MNDIKTQIAKMIEVDFEKNTLLMEVENKKYMFGQAGKYAIVPIEEYNKLVNGLDTSDDALHIEHVSNSSSKRGVVCTATTSSSIKTW